MSEGTREQSRKQRYLRALPVVAKHYSNGETSGSLKAQGSDANAYLKVTSPATEMSNFNEEDETKSATHVIPPWLDPMVRNGISSTGRSSTSTRRLSTATTSIHHKLLEAQLGSNDEFIDGFCRNRRARRGSICASELSRPMTPSVFVPHPQSEVPIDLDDQKIQQSYRDLSLSAQLLSRHLEAGRTKMDIKKILIVVKHHDDSLPPRASELVAWLLAQPEGFIIYVEDMLRSTESFNVKGLAEGAKNGQERIKYWTKHFCIDTAHTIDLVITLGGDGTVLFASCMFQHVVPPVVSFALGSFGFMTRHDFSQHQTILRNMFTQGFCVCLRARFAGRVMRSIPNNTPSQERNLEAEMLRPDPNVPTHELVEEFTALNEIVVDRGKNSTVSLTDIYTLDQRVASVMADGLIISTPTGSTAYNLAAGGSLCHPDMSAILITPICPHSLTLRPIILPDSMVVRFGLPYHARTTSSASFDGRQTVELQRGDYVQIAVSRFPFAVVQSDNGCDKDWFESIGRDFGWGIRKA